ncbi:MAG: tetratricopeptide repeat protein, partial [Spirochaetaceae bacterium]|nr:tetratricopeptide repeat protein [Spirochaetaceae bacterium]
MRSVLSVCLLMLFPLALLAAQQADGPTLFNRGTSLYQRGDFRRAYDALTESIEIFEESPEGNEQGLMNARLWAGAASFQLGRPGEAESF